VLEEVGRVVGEHARRGHSPVRRDPARSSSERAAIRTAVRRSV
jgi:hypothetical protein